MPCPTEAAIFRKHRDVKPPSQRDRLIVNDLRHHRMDHVEFDSTSNAEYRLFFVSVMHDISVDYPSLSREVERQVTRKIARQDRRTDAIVPTNGSEPLRF